MGCPAQRPETGTRIATKVALDCSQSVTCWQRVVSIVTPLESIQRSSFKALIVAPRVLGSTGAETGNRGKTSEELPETFCNWVTRLVKRLPKASVYSTVSVTFIEVLPAGRVGICKLDGNGIGRGRKDKGGSARLRLFGRIGKNKVFRIGRWIPDQLNGLTAYPSDQPGNLGPGSRGKHSRRQFSKQSIDKWPPGRSVRPPRLGGRLYLTLPGYHSPH